MGDLFTILYCSAVITAVLIHGCVTYGTNAGRWFIGVIVSKNDIERFDLDAELRGSDKFDILCLCFCSIVISDRF